MIGDDALHGLTRRDRGDAGRDDFAALLAGQSLDPLSVDELDLRVALLEAEIARVKAHRDRSAAHRAAADALFGRGAGGMPDGARG